MRRIRRTSGRPLPPGRIGCFRRSSLLHDRGRDKAPRGRRLGDQPAPSGLVRQSGVFSLCQEKDSRCLDRAVVMSVSDPLIPNVADEARAVASHLPGAEVLADGRATTSAITEKASGCGILHLACYGMFRADNPMFSSLRLHDAWLT